MAQSFDPGLTQRYTGNLRRIINRDGSFNVRRVGGGYHLYLHLISMSWQRFFLTAILTFFATNALFAVLYVTLGVENLQGGDTGISSYANAFFFSTQTLTTVGYGHISPRGYMVSSVAAFEAMLGVMGFAVLTGVLFGRVSRPSAKIVFSENMVIAPYEGGTSLQFRIANYRPNVLMDLDATMLLMTVVTDAGGQQKRKYDELALERSHVYFFPLTWTIVHPIMEGSPLYGRSQADLAEMHAEVLILIRAFDDTFSQTVHARHSYRHEEIICNAKFDPAFYFDEQGDMVLELPKVNLLNRQSDPPSPPVTRSSS